MIYVPFLPIHLESLEVSEYQRLDSAYINTKEYANLLFDTCEAYTGIEDGKVYLCGGVLEITDERAQVWSIMSVHTRGNMLGITRSVRGFMDQFNKKHKRIETPVKSDFVLGHKWAKMLGFEREGTMRSYDKGQDFDLYARVR